MPAKKRNEPKAALPGRAAKNLNPWESWSKLMARVQAGDKEAYRQLLEELGPLLYAFARRRVFDPHRVADAYQDLMLRFHKALHSYESARPFGPWLFAVARNSILDSLAKFKKVAEHEIGMDELPEPAPSASDEGLDDRLAAALKALPEPSRLAISLLKLEGLSLAEASKRLGISVAAVKARAHRGYALLRKELLKGERR